MTLMRMESSRKAPAVREMLEAAGASLLYLPPDSPDFNPTEHAFAKLKAPARSRRVHHPRPLERHRPHTGSLLARRVR